MCFCTSIDLLEPWESANTVILDLLSIFVGASRLGFLPMETKWIGASLTLTDVATANHICTSILLFIIVRCVHFTYTWYICHCINYFFYIERCMSIYIYTQSSFVFDMFYSSSCRMSKVGQCCSPRRRGHPLTRPESAGKKCLVQLVVLPRNLWSYGNQWENPMDLPVWKWSNNKRLWFYNDPIAILWWIYLWWVYV